MSGFGGEVYGDFSQEAVQHEDEENGGSDPGGLVGEAYSGVAEHGNEDRGHQGSCEHFQDAADDGEHAEANCLDGIAEYDEDGEKPVKRT